MQSSIQRRVDYTTLFDDSEVPRFTLTCFRTMRGSLFALAALSRHALSSARPSVQRPDDVTVVVDDQHVPVGADALAEHVAIAPLSGR